MPNTRRVFLLAVFVGVTLSGLPLDALASSTGMPWEAPIDKIKDSLTGPVALAISIIAVFATGAQLAFGGEMSDIMKRVVTLVLVLSLVLAAVSLVTTLFGASSAVIVS